jgi:predicted NUDIX family phosphoesterase
MWKNEMVLVMPDLLEAEENVILTQTGFEVYFITRGNGWMRPTDLLRPMNRGDADTVPNPYRLKIRQLVANVMVFILPDDLYTEILTSKGKTSKNEFFLIDRIINEATLYASVKTKQSSEARLHGKLAAGFGGHVDVVDATNSLDGVIRNAAIRELLEELKSSDDNIRTFESIVKSSIKPMGIINSSASEVESVYMGFISVLAFPESVGVGIGEPENLETASIPLAAFKGITDESITFPYEYDNWTKLVLNIPRNIYAGLIIRSVIASLDDIHAPK